MQSSRRWLAGTRSGTWRSRAAATTRRPTRRLTTFKIWAEEGPPKGTLYHYPNPYNHQVLSIAGAPAPHKIGTQIYTQAIQTQMAVRYFKGEPMEKTLAWAESEAEGFMRT